MLYLFLFPHPHTTPPVISSRPAGSIIEEIVPAGRDEIMCTPPETDTLAAVKEPFPDISGHRPEQALDAHGCPLIRMKSAGEDTDPHESYGPDKDLRGNP